MRITFAIAAIAALVAFTPAAQAATECKGAVPAGGTTDSQAWDNWRQAVANEYGSAWADLSLARYKSSNYLNLGLGSAYFVSAAPCRVMRVNASLLDTVGTLDLGAKAEPAPGKVSKGKVLSRFGN